MQFDTIVVFGCGVLGSQISWQIAASGFNVIVCEINEEQESRCRHFHEKYAQIFKTKEPLQKIKYERNLSKAASEASLIIESIPENLKIKEEFYKQISKHAKDSAIIATNSSTLKPPQLRDFVRHPERFLAMHFANPVWEAGIVEIMGHDRTDRKIFEKVVEFAKEIRLTPIEIHKDQRGYVLNALLIPWLAAAQHLYFTGVADFEDIDRVWMKSAKSEIGPFGIMDIIGLKTIYDINLMDAKKTGKKELFEISETIKKEFLDKGKLGVSSGEGFYKYPTPRYKKKGFLDKATD